MNKYRIFLISVSLGLSGSAHATILWSDSATTASPSPSPAPDNRTDTRDDTNTTDTHLAASQTDTTTATVRQEMDALVACNRFTTTRGYIRYLEDMGRDLKAVLSRLTDEHHWIDAGSGDCVALEEFLRSGSPQKPQTTGITYATKRSIPPCGGKLRVMEGRFIEDIPTSEIPAADVITDYYGPVSYSHRIDHVFAKYLNVLKPTGAVYLPIRGVLDLINLKGGKYGLNNTQIMTADGEQLGLVQWLMRNHSIKTTVVIHSDICRDCTLEEFHRANSETPTSERPHLVLKIEKRPQMRPRFPRLELIDADDGTPPERHFREVPRVVRE